MQTWIIVGAIVLGVLLIERVEVEDVMSIPVETLRFFNQFSDKPGELGVYGALHRSDASR
jgi:hypothetical protein